MLQRGKETNGVHSLIPARKICEDKRKMLACLIVPFVQIEHQKSDSKQLKLKRIELRLFKLESKKKKRKQISWFGFGNGIVWPRNITTQGVPQVYLIP